MKHQRLKAQEFKDILKHLRTYAPKIVYLEISKLVSHIHWLEDDRLMLERQLQEVRNVKLFEAKERRAPPKPTIKEPVDWGKIYYEICQNKERLEAASRVGTKNKEEIVHSANEWAKANGKPGVSFSD